ncbi:MAG: hypothetical protein Q8R55_03265 [Candidatus Taylorbacteria bacterium]|nr:hypothetical protein [Candidatus Taylorbacteria bacterium]
MNKPLLRQLIEAKSVADKKMSVMNSAQINKLEEVWDVEHAYYSSALEGSKLDKKEFEMLAREVK